MRPSTLLLLTALLPACAGGQPAATTALAPMRTDTVALRRTLDSLADAHHGVVGYSITNLETGEHLERRGDETFPTASLIKVSILVTLFDLVEKGRIGLDDPLTVLRIDQVPGSGMLQFMHPGITVSVRDAAFFMSTVSDNTATNLLLDKIGIRTTWAKMDSLGLHNTKIHSKVFKGNTSVAPDSSRKYGLGVTTPNEMARLFVLMGQGKAVSPAADSTMLDILSHNTNDEMLQRYAGGVRAAHKDGEVNQVRTECALFWLANRVVACVLTKENQDQRWMIDTEPQVTIARMGEAIVKAWAKPKAEANAAN